MVLRLSNSHWWQPDRGYTRPLAYTKGGESTTAALGIVHTAVRTRGKLDDVRGNHMRPRRKHRQCCRKRVAQQSHLHIVDACRACVRGRNHVHSVGAHVYAYVESGFDAQNAPLHHRAAHGMLRYHPRGDAATGGMCGTRCSGGELVPRCGDVDRAQQWAKLLESHAHQRGWQRSRARVQQPPRHTARPIAGPTSEIGVAEPLTTLVDQGGRPETFAQISHCRLVCHLSGSCSSKGITSCLLRIQEPILPASSQPGDRGSKPYQSCGRPS